MNWKKNPASAWRLYPVRRHRQKFPTSKCRMPSKGVYCIIDKDVIRRSHQKVAGALFKMGVDLVQLRYKNCPSYKLVRIAKKIRKLADRYQKILIINDRVDVARASGANGVHLGMGDLSPGKARILLNSKSIVGKTAHKIKDVKEINLTEIDYISAGPVYSTPLKKNLKKRGINFIKKIKKCAPLPVFAIGGINRRNARAVLRAGADGICVTRAIFEAKSLLKIKNDVN